VVVADESTGKERCASVSIWKPLQIPSTGTPRSAAWMTSAMIGEWLAIAPQRR
jgi:hypothetical protein